MKVNNKNSHQSWLEMKFKETVRYIYSDLKQEIGLYELYHDAPMSVSEQTLLNKLIAEFKQVMVDLYNELSEKGDFEDWQKELDWKVRAREMFKIIWVEGPDWIYNSYTLTLDDYDFRLKEIAHDEYMCELCETKGWGYDGLQQYVKQFDDEGEELPF